MQPTKIFLCTFLVLAVPFFCASDVAAIPGQSYYGDGATYIDAGTISPFTPWSWQFTIAHNIHACFACHGYIGISDYSELSYLQTGHKNAFRKVQQLPLALIAAHGGPDGKPYDRDQVGNFFNWFGSSPSNTITLGVCTVAGKTSQSSCGQAGGTWSRGPVTKDLFYIFDGWMTAGTATSGNTSSFAPVAVYDGSSYGCGRCHTTGFTMDTVIRTDHPPELTFPGINSKVNLDPDGGGPALSSSWGTGGPEMGILPSTLQGVQCERCHDATNHGATGPVPPRGTAATALCTQCHRQEHTMPYVPPYNTGLGANIIPTPFTDNPGMPTSDPLYALPQVEVGGSAGYALKFYSYSTGMEFLNSAHGKFTGTFQQISDPSKYNSSFVIQGTLPMCTNFLGIPLPQYTTQTDCVAADPANNWGPGPGSGCTTCHNVHQSVVEAAGAPAPIRVGCNDCHQKNISAMLHPQGSGTPYVNVLADPSSPCVICHMPRPVDNISGDSGRIMHIFRINTDPTYSTWPTYAQWTGGQKVANAASDNGYAAAVWVDLNNTCGQCHGGNTFGSCSNPSPAYNSSDLCRAAGFTWSAQTANGAPYFDKATLAGYAANIHNDQAINPIFIISRGSDGLTANVNASGSTCSGSNANCTSFDWNWGDGTAHGSGVTASHTYASGGEWVITLTVSQTGVGSKSRSQPFNAIAPDAGPTASCTFNFNPDTWVATCADTSTGSPGYPVTAVNVNWGDGLTSSGCKAATCSHTYLNAAPTGSYNVAVTAIDSNGMTNVAHYVSSPSGLLTISGTVQNSAGVAVPSAQVTIKLGGVIKAIVNTNPSGVFSSSTLKPGSTYNVTVTKGGYNFGPAPQKSGITATYAGTNVGIINSITP